MHPEHSLTRVSSSSPSPQQRVQALARARRRQGPSASSCLIVTSARASAALAAAVRRAASAGDGDGDGALPFPPVFALGEATARPLRDLPLPLDVRVPPGEEGGTGARLAEAVAKGWAGDDGGDNDEAEEVGGSRERRALFLRGDKSLDAVPAGLRSRSVACEELVVYRTAVRGAAEVRGAWRRAVAGRDGEGLAVVVVVFSPSGVAAAAEAAAAEEEETRVRWVAIGPTTAAALAEAGLEVAGVAGAPDARGVGGAVRGGGWG
jgi:uroporphyrinogen-III synthase